LIDYNAAGLSHHKRTHLELTLSFSVSFLLNFL
jgi:hypothetical protein